MLKLYRGTTLVAQADTVCTPERIRYAPAGGVLPGDYFVAGLRVRRRRPAGRAAHLQRHDHARHEHAADAVHRALATTFARHAAAQRARRRPVGQPEHRHARGVVLEGEQQPRATATRWSATSRRARRGTTTPKLNASTSNTTSATTRARPSRGPTRSQPGADPVPAHQPGAGLHASRGPTPGSTRRLQPGHAVRRRRSCRGESFDIAAAVDEPVRPAQPDARLGLHLGFTEDNWNAQDVELRPDRGVPRERRGPRQRAGRAAVAPPAVYAAARNNANMIDAARRLALDHEHVPVAAGGGRLLRPVRRRRLRRRRDRPRVRPHDREPHDRQGQPAAPATTRARWASRPAT